MATLCTVTFLLEDKKMSQSHKVSVLVSNNGEIPKAIPAFIAHPGNQVPKAIPAPQKAQLSIPTPAIVVGPTANAKSPSFIKSAKQVNLKDVENQNEG